MDLDQAFSKVPRPAWTSATSKIAAQSVAFSAYNARGCDMGLISGSYTVGGVEAGEPGRKLLGITCGTVEYNEQRDEHGSERKSNTPGPRPQVSSIFSLLEQNL